MTDQPIPDQTRAETLRHAKPSHLEAFLAWLADFHALTPPRERRRRGTISASSWPWLFTDR